jgi:Arc/MetJ-type ribon-helix-helix transcriptional regulator
MKRATITLPDELADLVDREAQRRQTSFSEVVRQFILLGLSGSEAKPREIPWAGLFQDPDMVPAERMDEELAAHWADDLDRDRR